MEQLGGIMERAGLPVWGAVPPQFLEQHREALLRRCRFQPQSLLVALLPYFAGDEPGNVSLYARGADYHTVLGERLKAAAAELQRKYPEAKLRWGCDAPPMPEVAAAQAAGLGDIGQNGLLLTPKWGSFVFIGTIAADIPLIASVRPAVTLCTRCGACEAACPTGALRGGRVDRARCLSALTQKKGELTQEEAASVARAGMVWGCDRCQQACPVSASAALTPVPELKEGLVRSLRADRLCAMSDDELTRAYEGRAFLWRGAGILRRNASLIQENHLNNI